jgi:hypothetical protein
LLHQVGDLFELNVKLRSQKVNGTSVRTSNLALKRIHGYSARWVNYQVTEGLIYSRVGKRSRELDINKLQVQLITTVIPG